MQPEQQNGQPPQVITPSGVSPQQPPAQPQAPAPQTTQQQPFAQSGSVVYNTAHDASLENLESATSQPAVAQPVAQPSVLPQPQPPAPAVPTQSPVQQQTQAAPEPPEETSAPQPPKRLWKIIAVVAALLVLTGAGALLALRLFAHNIALAEYQSEVMTLLYPDGYELQDRNNALAFIEPGDPNGERSGVIVAIEELPDSLSDEEVSAIEDSLGERIDSFAQSAITNEGQEIKNEQFTHTTLSGFDASKVTSELFQDNEKVGDFYIVSGINGNRLVLLAVLAHTSDPGVRLKAQEIIDSFTLR